MNCHQIGSQQQLLLPSAEMFLYGVLLLIGLVAAGEQRWDHHDGHKGHCGVKGVGPGYAKSHLDYAGHFKGGARQFLPIYKKVHGSEHEVVIKGGRGAHDHPEHVPEHEEHEKEPRHKRGFITIPEGGARKFLPIYKKIHGSEHEVIIKGGSGACGHKPCDHHVHPRLHEEKEEKHEVHY
ncbi:hypothetical protein D918_01874 [Trichuris suis]|nr:hypothetical protein D918_01874 [Trichuris suis]